jgi:hypothetical protein
MEASFIDEGTLSTGCGVQFHGCRYFAKNFARKRCVVNDQHSGVGDNA